MIAAAVLIGGLGAAKAEGSAAHQFCAMQWASDEAAMSRCVEGQIAGAQAMVRYLRGAGSVGGESGERAVAVVDFCQSRWAPDFELIEACVRARGPRFGE